MTAAAKPAPRMGTTVPIPPPDPLVRALLEALDVEDDPLVREWIEKLLNGDGALSTDMNQ